ncbi:MAG: methyltransferase domain-containing protein [Rhodospirillaceae bacterium]
MSIKLNIGSRARVEGWKNFDIAPGPEVDFVGDCVDLSQIADGSVDTIYASHVLEHISYQVDLQAALREWFRVLAPGGTVMISVPDLEMLCRLYLSPTLKAEHRFQIMQIMFGGQIDEFDFHAVGLSHELLGYYLTSVGFQDAKRVEQFGLFPDCSLVQVAGVPISLNMTARKP